MSARKLFPKDTNGSPYELGLVLQSKSEVDTNEFGMEQGTLTFACYNRHLRKYRPARGTRLTEFAMGDDVTRAKLRDLNYLGAQTSRKILNGLSPGKGLLVVMAQGAIFDGDSRDFKASNPAAANDPITKPWSPSTSSKQTLTFHTFREVPNSSPPSFVPVLDVALDYYSIDLYFEYMAQQRAPTPRFLQDQYSQDEAGLVVVDALSNTRIAFKLQVNSASAWKTNIAIVNNNPTIVPGTGLPAPVDEAAWRPWVKYVGRNAQFRQVEAGPYFHVLETNSIQLEPVIPDGAIVTG